jgi:hypothetical protein
VEEGPGDISRLLERWSGGDRAAFQELIPVVYDELRRLASRYLQSERGGHTLQSTALVHEAYVRRLGGSFVITNNHRRDDYLNLKMFLWRS